MEKIIIHIDMDAFYAAIEERDNQNLKGKVLVIGSLPHERGVVCTCNYEARKYGIHSAMNIKEAYARCKDAIFLHPDFDKYKEVSDQIHLIWRRYSDCIEYLSLDEGYIDVSSRVKSFDEAIELAKKIKLEILNEIGLTCSVGIGYSLMSAKLASEEKKPNGIYYIRNKKELIELIKERPVSVIYGVGKKTKKKLEELGIKLVKDIYQKEDLILLTFKSYGNYIINMAKGIDERDVMDESKQEAKSIAREYTFQENVQDIDFLKEILLLLAKDVVDRLREKNKKAKTITLKLSYSNMKTITRSKMIFPSNNLLDIYNCVSKLLDETEHLLVRLIGLSVSNFLKEDFVQMNIFELTRDYSKEENELLKRIEKSKKFMI